MKIDRSKLNEKEAAALVRAINSWPEEATPPATEKTLPYFRLYFALLAARKELARLSSEGEGNRTLDVLRSLIGKLEVMAGKPKPVWPPRG